MIITFFGHSQISNSEKELYSKIETIFKKQAELNPSLMFYCGHKGQFDYLCESCIDSLKINYPLIQKVYITPYLSIDYQKKHLNDLKDKFDNIIFPVDCEKCPPRFAYSRRNRWMINQADIILFYVNHSWGGAAASLEYAQKKNKFIINIGRNN